VVADNGRKNANDISQDGHEFRFAQSIVNLEKKHEIYV